MSDSKMYNILGIMKGLNDNATRTTQLNESVNQPTVYETVEPQGSIMEAVKSLEEKYKGFKKVAEARDPNEPADIDSDAVAKRKRLQAIKDRQEDERAERGGDDKTTSIRKVAGKAYGGTAQKDAEEKDELDEGQGPYELYNPKHPKFKANYDKFKAKNPAAKLTDFIEAMKKREHGVNEESSPDEKEVCTYCGNPRGGKRSCCGEVHFEKAPVDEAMFPGSKVGNVLRGADHNIRQSDATKLAAIAAPAAGAGAALGSTLGAAGGTSAGILFAPLLGTGAIMGLGAVLAAGLTYKVLQWLGRKVFGTTAEAYEFAKAHLNAAKSSQPKFEFQGKSYPVKVKNSRQIDQLENELMSLRSNMSEDLDEAFEFGSKNFKNASGLKKAPKLSKAKPAKLKESIDMRNHPIYTTQEAWDHYAKELAEQEGQGEQYVVCIVDYSQSGEPIVRRTAPVEKAKADELLANAVAKDKFTNPLFKTIYPASEGKLTAEQIMQKFPDMGAKEESIDAMQELDEIAKLAGLKTEMNNKIPGDSDSPLTHANACPVCEMAPCGCSHEEELDERETFPSMPKTTAPVPAAPAVKSASYDKSKLNPMSEEEEWYDKDGNVDPNGAYDAAGHYYLERDVSEGNEFSGALAAAKASGAKEFEVDGKKYTVKEDINVNITANGEEDALNLIRKLSGMSEVHAEPVIAVGEDVEEGPKERDIEYTNTPREEQAGADAAFPGGTDLNRPKKSYSDKPYRGDNPMAVAEAKEEALWKAYESMIKDVKA